MWTKRVSTTAEILSWIGRHFDKCINLQIWIYLQQKWTIITIRKNYTQCKKKYKPEQVWWHQPLHSEEKGSGDKHICYFYKLQTYCRQIRWKIKHKIIIICKWKRMLIMKLIKTQKTELQSLIIVPIYNYYFCNLQNIFTYYQLAIQKKAMETTIIKKINLL